MAVNKPSPRVEPEDKVSVCRTVWPVHALFPFGIYQPLLLYTVFSPEFCNRGYILECTEHLCHNLMHFFIQVNVVLLAQWSVIIESLPERGGGGVQ